MLTCPAPVTLTSPLASIAIAAPLADNAQRAARRQCDRQCMRDAVIVEGRAVFSRQWNDLSVESTGGVSTVE